MFGKISLLGLLSGALCLISLQVTANTLYFVRHAEKQNVGADPELTSCGQARADALAGYFANADISAVYATAYQRTQQTGAPVARQHQSKIYLYDARDPSTLLGLLRAAETPVLVVGHSNTIPQLITQLSGIDIAPLSEQDFSMLYQLDLGEEISVTLRRQTFDCNALQETELAAQ